MATGSHTADEQEELPAPRDSAAELAAMHREMLAESPADTVIGANQNVFNRYYRSLIGLGLHPGEEPTGVQDPIDMQALKVFSAFEHGRPVTQNDSPEQKRRRFETWLHHLAASIGVRALPDELYPVLLGERPVDQAFVSEEAFRQTIQSAYRGMAHLSEERMVADWVTPGLTQAVRGWPATPQDRSRAFRRIFRQVVVPAIRTQWDRNQARVATPPTQPDMNDAEFDRQASAVADRMERLAPRQQTEEQARQLLEGAAQRLALVVFSPDELGQGAVRNRRRELQRHMASLNRPNAWAPLPDDAQATARPTEPRHGTGRQATGGGAPEEGRQTAQGQPAEGAPEARAQDTRPQAAPQTARQPGWLRRRWNWLMDVPGPPSGLAYGNNPIGRWMAGVNQPRWLHIPRIALYPSVFVYQHVVSQAWRQPRHAAATVGSAALGALAGGPVGAVVGGGIGGWLTRHLRRPVAATGERAHTDRAPTP